MLQSKGNYMQTQEQIKLIDGLGIGYFVRHDLRDTSVLLGDYLRLHKLNFGDILFCHDGNSTVPLFVGNCTPYCSPTTSDGGIGWAWTDCNHLQVLAVYGVSLNCGSFGEISATCGFDKDNNPSCHICSDPNCSEPSQKH
jgi:hypothetical protein